MKLRGSRYRLLLEALEDKTSQIEDLRHLDVPIDVLSDFEEFRDASGMATIGITPALYQKSRKMVFINDPKFTTLEASEQEAILMHEVGHADRHARGIDKLSIGNECIEADLLAARWGFGDALVKMRRRDYGDDYARRLATHASDEDGCRAALRDWQFQRLFDIP